MSGVGRVGIVDIRNRVVEEQFIQEVVDKIHLSGCVSVGAVNVAVKLGCYVKGGLPDVGKLCDDPNNIKKCSGKKHK